jgi:hypothetical protein
MAYYYLYDIQNKMLKLCGFTWFYVKCPYILLHVLMLCDKENNKNYAVTMILKCNMQFKTLKILNDKTFDENKCNNVIEVESSEGNNISLINPACPKYSYVSWWNITPLNKYFLAAILFSVGIFFGFFGYLFSDILISIIIATGLAILIKTLFTPCMNIHILGKENNYINSFFGYWSCNCFYSIQRNNSC